MQDELLPLFPLPLVLFPRTPLPLHIFEDRYKEMIAEVRRGRGEFGIVQAGEKGVVNTGCTATIEKVLQEHPDGRMDILTFGRQRFELLQLNDDLPYLRGQIEYFDDEDDEPAGDDLIRRAIRSYETLRDVTEDELAEPAADDPQLSFQLAQPLGDLNFRQLLLATKSETERLRLFVEFVPEYRSRQTLIAHVKEVAPRNGHSKWPASL